MVVGRPIEEEEGGEEKTPAVKPSTSKELPPAPSYGMKRDVSRIFTVMEEVEGEGDAEGEKVPDVVRDAVKARKTARFLSVAPAGFVIPDLPVTKRAQTTDDIQSKLSASGGSRLSIGVVLKPTLMARGISNQYFFDLRSYTRLSHVICVKKNLSPRTSGKKKKNFSQYST
ncbi:melanosome assembly [Homalodisca vitripennis]|nr:melanosome assembly [Homalodisca vitripennis]